MKVTHLSLTDFRNYRTAEVPFAVGANLFVGRNGQGKTNLVESLSYLSTLGSHRVSGEQALIRMDAQSAVVRARVQHDDRELLVEAQLNRGSPNRAQVNRAAIKPRELPRYFSSVLFAPEDLALVRGEPSARRRFLDQLLVQRNPRFAAVIADYERVLKQRNTLLKSARSSGVRKDRLGTLDIWDERLVALGAELIDARLDLIDRLSEPLVAAYRSLAGDDHHPRLLPQLTILGAHVEDEDGGQSTDATTSGGAHEVFSQALSIVRSQELERGLTLLGPHRDDVLFELNGLPAKGYASHGESWSFALALKLASAELLRHDSTTGDPVLILDDVFAELDHSRRQMLATAVAGFEQVLITAAVCDDVPEALTAHTVRVEAGAIVGSS